MKPEHRYEEYMFRLYVKWPGQTKFRPVDWSTGEQVNELMYATLFSKSEVGEVVATIERHQPGAFEYRFKKVRMD
jgi:hypothetical protein